MSRIDELIDELCPEGVEFMELREVAPYSTARVDAQTLDKTSFVGVDNLLPDKAGRVDATHRPNTDRLARFGVGDVLLGNIRPYLKKVWLADRPGGCSGDVLALQISEKFRDRLLPAFLYYQLSSDDFFAYNVLHSKGAKMPRGDKSAILRYRVSMPPLDVQREIVQVLDKFRSLDATLQAELEARHFQRSALANNFAVDLRERALTAHRRIGGVRPPPTRSILSR